MGLVHSNRANVFPRRFLSHPRSELFTDNESETDLRHEENLRDLLTTYLQHHRIGGSTDSTIIHKRKEIRLFVEFLANCGHSMEAKEVTFANVVAHMEDMTLRNLASSTIQTRKRALHAWFEWMVDLRIIRDNPVSRIKLARTPRRRKPFLTKAQFQSLLDQCQPDTLTGSRRAAILWLLATTGMRRRELWLLEKEDLDWDRGRILITNGKGQKDRLVPFSPLAQEAVHQYLYLRKEYSDPLLWVSQNGQLIGYHSLGRDIKRLYECAGVTVKDDFHIFRRTFARDAILQGIPRQYIQAIAGWADGQMLDLYTAAMQQEEKAVDAFSDFEPFVD